MNRNLLVLAVLGIGMVAIVAAARPALALTSCAAGNPNPVNVLEATPATAFVNHDDGTVTHRLTGLMWKQCAQGLSGPDCATGTATLMTWSAALAAAVTDTTAGYGDWRLANKKELESIVESCGFDPAVNLTMFPSTPAAAVWSSTTWNYVGLPQTHAFFVAFTDGATDQIDKQSLLYARLVRGGQQIDAFDANHPLQTVLDIDGNGKADALTDGLLVIRYLFGLRDASLIQGAVGPGAQRSDAPAIGTYLESLTQK